ncbi:MAG: class II aldolase/adducin family protein [Deltaproteobacteria bacterium]|nr:class II aldolase/adducin family protein [Deltaproteobacteria bacterium]
MSASKEGFCQACHLLYERRLVTGSGGNLSLRVGGKVYLTPTGCSLRDMSPDMVVTVDMDGQVLEGAKPTMEAGMHLGLLRERQDINVVCHVHGAYIIAASSTLFPAPDTFPPLTPGFVYHAHPLPMLPFMVPGTRVLAETVTRELSLPTRKALVLQNHGLVTLGKDLKEALNAAEEIDDVARICVFTKGKAKVISHEDIEKICPPD